MLFCYLNIIEYRGSDGDDHLSAMVAIITACTEYWGPRGNDHLPRREAIFMYYRRDSILEFREDGYMLLEE